MFKRGSKPPSTGPNVASLLSYNRFIYRNIVSVVGMLKYRVRSITLNLGFLLASLLFVLAGGWAVSGRLLAAQGEPPPFPIVYHGRVMIDGHLGNDNMHLVARVGDYATHPVRIKNGQFLNLVVQPPTRSYFDMVITFHTEMLQARESGVFLERASPHVQTMDLNFSTPTGEGMPGTESGMQWVAIAAVVGVPVVVIVCCVWWLKRCRWYRRRNAQQR